MQIHEGVTDRAAPRDFEWFQANPALALFFMENIFEFI